MRMSYMDGRVNGRKRYAGSEETRAVTEEVMESNEWTNQIVGEGCNVTKYI